MKEEIIIQEALDQLRIYTGIRAAWKAEKARDLDGRITFHNNRHKYQIYVEIKKELRNHQLTDLLQLKKKYHPLIVVAEYIFPKLKEELRQEGIGYLETNGNIYFKEGDILLWLDGQKPKPKVNEKSGRAFTKTGLKVVFHFLLYENMVNQTYRDIAKITGVGFGNINFIMTDLKEQGFLIPLTSKTYKLVNQKQLFNKWLVAYKEKLKPLLMISKFRFLKEEDLTKWKQIPLKKQRTWWGGEPAANLLTNYLKPEIFTLYTTETKSELIKNYRLVPDQNGNVEVYLKFWHFDEVNGNVVPPLLVYIDLLNTGDRRCLQAAEKIKNEFFQNRF